MGSYTAMHVSSLLSYPARVRPGFFSGLGWMILYLKNTYGFIRHGIRVTLLCLVREVTAWYNCSARYDITRSEYGISPREKLVLDAASFVSFSDPWVGSVGPARGAPARRAELSGRQL